MKSQWYKYKDQAIALRKRGYSIRTIEQRLKVPKSTLSFWFRFVVLSKTQEAKLKQEWMKGLVKARVRAVLWHNAQKAARLAQAEQEARSTLKNIDLKNKHILDLALSMLYWGEGSKGNSGTSMGNSDPNILRFFISILRKNYRLKLSDIKADLHIRADQDPEKVKNFWVKELGLPKTSFMSISIDNRTKGSKTYETYNGVCVVRCQRYAIQRKLIFLSKLVCEKVSNI